jgi:hypothetical protein
MVLLSRVTEDEIVTNLRKRYLDDQIFVSWSTFTAFYQTTKKTVPTLQ